MYGFPRVRSTLLQSLFWTALLLLLKLSELLIPHRDGHGRFRSILLLLLLLLLHRRRCHRRRHRCELVRRGHVAIIIVITIGVNIIARDAS